MFFFMMLDGFGIGAKDESNFLARSEFSFFSRFQGVYEPAVYSLHNKDVLVTPIDTSLGVEGIPQSATSQTTLFTGINAAKKLGYHLCAYPNTECCEIVAEHNILKKLNQQGRKARYINGYTQEYFEYVEKGKLRHSVTTIMALNSGYDLFMFEDTRTGKAVYHDITAAMLKNTFGYYLDEFSPEESAANALEIAKQYDLCVYEYFISDMIGHRRIKGDEAIQRISELERFICALIDGMNDDDCLVITSDHGNIEDLTTKSHTNNPVPLISVGVKKNIPRKIEHICSWICRHF